VQYPEESNEVGAARPAVHEVVEGGAVARRIECPDVIGRSIAHDREQPLDRTQDACDTSEGERRRTEADHLAILGPVEAPDYLDRIGRRIRVIEVGVKAVERGFERRRVHEVASASSLRTCTRQVAYDS